MQSSNNHRSENRSNEKGASCCGVVSKTKGVTKEATTKTATTVVGKRDYLALIHRTTPRNEQHLLVDNSSTTIGPCFFFVRGRYFTETPWSTLSKRLAWRHASDGLAGARILDTYRHARSRKIAPHFWGTWLTSSYYYSTRCSVFDSFVPLFDPTKGILFIG
jgi:hypothetical protein